MSFRFRPSFEVLELRENPSTSGLVDSNGVPIDPPQPDPTPTQTTPPPGSTTDAGAPPRG